jgi:hypothetical protein
VKGFCRNDVPSSRIWNNSSILAAYLASEDTTQGYTFTSTQDG